jgi:UMF1 family MFS transporter
MYDFANSAFYTSIMAVIYQVYFSDVVVQGPHGTALWGYTTSAAFALVFVTAPVIGAICDFAGRKKRLTALFWAVGCAATAGLALTGPGDVWPAALTLIAALFCFQATVALTNAYLPELVPVERANKTSGFAWAMGYVGGALCLGLNLWMVHRGWTRQTFVVVAGWWLLFSIPFFVFVRERARPRPAPGGYVAAGFRQVRTTLMNIRENRELYKFLMTFMLINAGLITVVLQASNFGRENLGMSPEELVRVILMVQIVAAPGAMAFGWIADRLGSKKTLFILLASWMAVCVWAYLTRTKGEFWGVAALVATVMGGTQSVCRAAVAQLSPTDRVAEYYGFFAMAGMASEVVGLSIYSIAIAALQDPRAGILAVAALFAAGMGALATVREPRAAVRAP